MFLSSHRTMETSPQGPPPSSGNGPSSDLNTTIVTVADSNHRPMKKRKTDGSTDGVSQQLDYIPLEGPPRKTVPLPPRPLTQQPTFGVKSLLDQRAERLQEVVPVRATQRQPQKRVKGPAVTPAAVTKNGISKNQKRKARLRAAKEALEADAKKQSENQVALVAEVSGTELSTHSAKEAKEVNVKTPSEEQMVLETKAPGTNSNHLAKEVKGANVKKASEKQVALDTKAPGTKSNHMAKVVKEANTKNQMENRISYTKTPWMESSDYSDLPSVQAIFTRELSDFVRYMEPTEEEHQVRSYVFLLVEREVQKLWPTSRLIMYGSYRTRVYLPTSDMDMVIHRDPPITLSEMRRLKSHFQNIRIGTGVEFVASAKVPLVKFNELHSGIAVDISFNHQDGVQSGTVTTQLLENTPGLRSLMIILKHYLSIHGQNTPFFGGIGSYTLMIMIVSFLQMHPHVQSRVIDPQENIGVLLIEFFELYGLCFNFNRVGIAIADGGSYLPKAPISKKAQTPFFTAVALQTFDPNNASNDTGKVSSQFPSIRKMFERTFTSITSELARRHQSLFTGSSEIIAKNRAEQQESLLGHFLFVSSKMTKQRSRVQKVFYDGIFQKMFSHPPPQKFQRILVPVEQPRTIPAVQGSLDKSGDWLDGEVDQLRLLCQSWQGDQLGMDTMMEMGRQLIIAQSKRAIAVVEENQGAPMSDEERGRIFEETLMNIEKRLSFLEEAVKLHQRQMGIEKAQADLRRSEETTIPSPPQEVEFVHAMDTDDEEPGHADEDDYFSDLMHRAGKEYGDSDSEDEGADATHAIMIKSDSEEVPSGAGHRNPQNVHVSEESILLPQLYSASPSQTHGNSSRDEQIEAMLRRAEGLDD